MTHAETVRAASREDLVEAEEGLTRELIRMEGRGRATTADYACTAQKVGLVRDELRRRAALDCEQVER